MSHEIRCEWVLINKIRVMFVTLDNYMCTVANKTSRFNRFMITIALLMVSANILIRIETKFWMPSQCFSSTFYTYQYLTTSSNVPLLMCHTIGDESCKGETIIIQDISLVSCMVLFHLQDLCLFFTHYSCLQLHVYWYVSSRTCRTEKLYKLAPKKT
jgi:hypothetical protein